MRPFEIYNAAHLWNGCSDLRPWVIIEARPGSVVACFPIATECYREPCFRIDSSHSDFGRTGLRKTCHIIDHALIELRREEFGERRGELSNALLAAFRAYAGV